MSGGLRPTARRMDPTPSWPCAVDAAHGQAGVRLTDGIAVCGTCAYPIRDLIFARDFEAAEAALGLGQGRRP